MRFRFVLALACAALVAGCATHAATSGRVVIRDQNQAVDVAFSREDRARIEQYYDARKPKRVPPGLAKRDGLPPGLAKRDRLPPGLETRALPVELEQQLTPLASTHVRVRVGADVVLMVRNTRVIVDVIHGVAH